MTLKSMALGVILSTFLYTPGSARPFVLRDQVKVGANNVSVKLDSRPLPMIGFSQKWQLSSAPIIVSVSAAAPKFTVYARATYGFVSKPGSYVYISLDGKYFAPGDTQPAEPRNLGSPMRPDVRSQSGYSNLELNIGDGNTLLLVAEIKGGMASIRLRHQGGLSENISYANLRH